MKLLIVWKSDNEIDIHNFIVPYAYNAKKHEWFEDVEVLIWGGSQEKVKDTPLIQQRVHNLVKNEIKIKACKMCSDKLEVTEVLESLGVEVVYTGVYLSEKLKDPNYQVITL